MKSEHPSDLRPRTRNGWGSSGPLIAAIAGVALFATGCVNSYELKVDSLAKPKAEEAVSYKIVNKNPAVPDDSLRYKEAAGFVRTALSGKGLYEASDAEKADLVVALDYGVGPPLSRRETVSEPVYVQLPGQIRVERVQVGTDRNGNPVYQSVTVQDPPRTEFAGYREYIVTVTVYEKFLRLNAAENKPAAEGRPPAEIWTVDVTSEGESKDIRKALPILAAASIDYVGKDSKGQKTIRIKDTDKDVAFIRKGM
jgi:hypothetical protein